MPEITRTVTDIQKFATKHNIFFVPINIQELIDETGKRIRLLSGNATIADRVWTR